MGGTPGTGAPHAAGVAPSSPGSSPLTDERLRRAQTPEDVIRLARECLEALDSREIALLPERCRPRALHCAHDVSSYAFDLVAYYAEETNASVRLVKTSRSLRRADQPVRSPEVLRRTAKDWRCGWARTKPRASPRD